MTVRVWPISHAWPFRASILLILAALRFSLQLALAQFTQQGSLVGTGAANSPIAAEQGASVALSSDGNTAIVGGPNDEADGNTAIVSGPGDSNATGAAWVSIASRRTGCGS
jgi:hypothetical protein